MLERPGKPHPNGLRCDPTLRGGNNKEEPEIKKKCASRDHFSNSEKALPYFYPTSTRTLIILFKFSKSFTLLLPYFYPHLAHTFQIQKIKSLQIQDAFINTPSFFVLSLSPRKGGITKLEQGMKNKLK